MRQLAFCRVFAIEFCMAVFCNGCAEHSETMRSDIRPVARSMTSVKMREVRRVGEDLRFPSSVSFSPNSDRIIVAAELFLKSYDVASGKELPENMDYGLYAPFAFSADGRHVAAKAAKIGFDGVAVFRYPEWTEKVIVPNTTSSPSQAIAFAPDGKTIAIAEMRTNFFLQAYGRVIIVAVDDGRIVHSFD